jgi:uncharacterized protein with GYD domain
LRADVADGSIQCEAELGFIGGLPHRGSVKWGAKPMSQYIMLVNFTDQGLKGVKDVPNRQDKSRETAKQFGVERKTVWMTFGPYDFVHLYEAPNDDAMAKFVMSLSSFGNVRTTVMRAWDESEHLPLIRELT